MRAGLARTRGKALGAAGLAAAALAAPGLACGGSSESPESSPAIDAFDFGFAPATITVPAGTRVSWSNSGDTIHTVKGEGFFSQSIDPGRGYEHRFADPGTYRYVCTLHPTLMTGTVVVSK